MRRCVSFFGLPSLGSFEMVYATTSDSLLIGLEYEAHGLCPAWGTGLIRTEVVIQEMRGIHIVFWAWRL
jgi:hypothetical protein